LRGVLKNWWFVLKGRWSLDWINGKPSTTGKTQEGERIRGEEVMTYQYIWRYYYYIILGHDEMVNAGGCLGRLYAN